MATVRRHVYYQLDMTELEYDALQAMIRAAEKLTYGDPLPESNKQAIVAYQRARNLAAGEELVEEVLSGK